MGDPEKAEKYTIENHQFAQGQIIGDNNQVTQYLSYPMSSTTPDFIISTSPLFQSNRSSWIDVNAIEQSLTIKNIGKENAYNVCAALFGCETYIVPQTMPQKRMDGTDGYHWREISYCPVEPGATLALTLHLRRGTLQGPLKIGTYPLHAPPEPGLGESMQQLDLPFSSARLTLTYRDSSHRKYAQAFDYHHAQNAWAYLSHPEPVSIDLLDLLTQEQ